MTDCAAPGYDSPFDALTSDNRMHNGNHACEKCQRCGKWHVRAIPPIDPAEACRNPACRGRGKWRATYGDQCAECFAR